MVAWHTQVTTRPLKNWDRRMRSHPEAIAAQRIQVTTPPLNQIWDRLARHGVGPNREARERAVAEGRAEGRVGGVSPTRDHDAPDARDIVTSVERVPLSVQVRLEPAREIHGSCRALHANIAQVAGAIARGNVHAAAEGDGQMRKVAAYAGALLIGLPGGLGASRVAVTKRQVSVHEVADGLHAAPAAGRSTEELPSRGRKPVRFAVAATE